MTRKHRALQILDREITFTQKQVTELENEFFDRVPKCYLKVIPFGDANYFEPVPIVNEEEEVIEKGPKIYQDFASEKYISLKNPKKIPSDRDKVVGIL